jgi:hypothetical protein
MAYTAYIYDFLFIFDGLELVKLQFLISNSLLILRFRKGISSINFVSYGIL